ncbi:tRNA lysidine(34) synthetase TilS [Castellaniella hirudinis]|uniref:tRNA(Ile)-lysidine synthase n=1 Tax=Castellaniella hirudinis TaxID=1144617 RepID=A0ABV8RXM9_9BURK
MGASRTPDSPALDPSLLRAVDAALAALPAGAAVGVALSAGADSAVLALHAAHAARRLGLPLHCFHIHHGLQAEADGWLIQAHRLAGLLGVGCHSRRVTVDVDGRGMEAAARDARYAALAELAAHAGVGRLLLAHHQDDQAETVLLRLLRGTGPLGLAAMRPVTARGGLVWLRPWLDQPRSLILDSARRFEALSGWRPVRDPSNADERYARGALRTGLTPVLDARWPAWRRTLARHAAQARDLSDWVDETAQADWAGLDPDPDDQAFSLAAWRALPLSRQAPVLRHWLRILGLRMPTEARLQAWLRQLRGVHALGHDRDVRLGHEGVWIVVRRGRVLRIPKTQVE